MGGRILTGEINCSDIKVTTGLEVEGRTNHVAVSEGTKDLDITINRKEYNIVGDEIYIPKLYDDAPQWLKDLVDVVVEVGVEANNADLLGQVQDLINQLANATVPLNTFTQSIIALNLEDARINTVVETLNSNFSDATSNINAQIIDVRNTFVSKDEAAATIANVISAEIDNGVLQNMATVGHVATALATETAARAADYTALESSIAGESEATATAINTINTYVGIDQAGASTGTGLSAYLVDSNGVVGGADSQVANAVYIDNGVPKSKWEYGSVINIGGVNYTSGFGLKTVGSASEFWIDASKLKFTNSNSTGQVAPFTIDASGTTPQVKFNGVVEFSNVTNVPQLGSTPQEVVNAVNSGQTTTINGSKITTGSITAAQIVADSALIGKLNVTGGLTADSIKANTTIVSPTIEAATFIGTYLSINEIKVKAEGYPNNFGPVVINKPYVYQGVVPDSTTVSVVSDYFLSRSENTGYHGLRMCSATQRLLLKAKCSASSGTFKNLYLYYSINNGNTYILLDSIINSVNTTEVIIVKDFTHTNTNSLRFKAEGSWRYTGGNGNILVTLDIFSTNS